MLAKMLLEAEHYHTTYEPTAPRHHWSDWYAAFMAARQDGLAPADAADAARRHTEGADKC